MSGCHARVSFAATLIRRQAIFALCVSFSRVSRPPPASRNLRDAVAHLPAVIQIAWYQLGVFSAIDRDLTIFWNVGRQTEVRSEGDPATQSLMSARFWVSVNFRVLQTHVIGRKPSSS